MQPQEVVFGAPSPELARSVVQAMEIFPEKMRVRQLRERVPTFHASVILPKAGEPVAESQQRLSQPSKTAIFFLSGAPGSGPEHAFIAAEFFNAAKAHPELGQLALSAAIGSALSTDTEGSPFVAQTAERAAYLAAFIYELVEKQGIDQIYLVGQSLGGVELPYLGPLLKRLFSLRQQKTTVGGIVMHQPGGMAKRNLKESLAFMTTRTARVASRIDEAIYMFPSIEDIADMMIKIGHARDRGDHPLADNLERTLSDMRNQRERNQHYIETYLSDEQKQRLEQVERKIAKEHYGGSSRKLSRLYKERIRLLQTVVEKLLSDRAKELKNPSPGSFINLLPLVGPNRGITGMTPAEIRALSDFPVAVTASEKDVYFPEREITAGIMREQIERYQRLSAQSTSEDSEKVHQASRLFPNAPETFLVEIANLPHTGTTVDIERVAPMLLDIMKRMQEASHDPQPGKTTRLSYF